MWSKYKLSPQSTVEMKNSIILKEAFEPHEDMA